MSNEVVTYMTPLTTIGEVSSESLTSVWNSHATCMRLTLRALIWLAGWNRLCQ